MDITPIIAAKRKSIAGFVDVIDAPSNATAYTPKSARIPAAANAMIKINDLPSISILISLLKCFWFVFVKMSFMGLLPCFGVSEQGQEWIFCRRK